jgi:hypothetical protein
VPRLLSLDGADHNRLRRLVVCQAFTPRSTARLQTTIARVITELVNPVTATGRCDVVADIARRYPIPIICELLGAPRCDWQLFSDWADDIFKIFNWNVVNDEPVIMAARDQLDAYLNDMIAQRRHNLTDDLISELIRAEDDGDRLTADELTMLAVGPADGRNRHHPQSAGRRRGRSVRSPPAVGPAGTASRARTAGSRRAHAPQPSHFRHHAQGRRGCRTRRREGLPARW